MLCLSNGDFFFSQAFIYRISLNRKRSFMQNKILFYFIAYLRFCFKVEPIA